MSKYSFKIHGKEYNVEIKSIESGTADVVVNGTDYSVELGDAVQEEIKLETKVQEPVLNSPVIEKSKARNGAQTITSPLPGIVISIDVNKGDSVKRGQKIAVIEAMKMENEILAESDGTVSTIFASKGDSVMEGTKILEIA